MLRIRQVHRDTEGGLFKDYAWETDHSQEIFDFMTERKDRIRELSLRMCLKIADLVKIAPNNWRLLAENTVMRSRT
jgi:hypothetical protein